MDSEKKAREIELLRGFIRSDIWTWLKERLTTQRDKLIEQVADPRWTPEQRALLCGTLGVVNDILTDPERILRTAEAAKKALEKVNPARRAAPMVTPD